MATSTLRHPILLEAICISIALLLPFISTFSYSEPEHQLCQNQAEDYHQRAANNSRYSLFCHVSEAEWREFRDEVIDKTSLLSDAQSLTEAINNEDYDSPLLNRGAYSFDLIVFAYVQLSDHLSTDHFLHALLTWLLPAEQFGRSSIRKVPDSSLIQAPPGKTPFNGLAEADFTQRYTEIMTSDSLRDALATAGSFTNDCPEEDSFTAIATWINLLHRAMPSFVATSEKGSVFLPPLSAVYKQFDIDHRSLKNGGSLDQAMPYLGGTNIPSLLQLRKSGFHPVAIYHPRLKHPFLKPDRCFAGPALAAWHDMLHLGMLATLRREDKLANYSYYEMLTGLDDNQNNQTRFQDDSAFIMHYSEAVNRLLSADQYEDSTKGFIMESLKSRVSDKLNQPVTTFLPFNQDAFFSLLDIAGFDDVIGQSPRKLHRFFSSFKTSIYRKKTEYDYLIAFNYLVFRNLNRFSEEDLASHPVLKQAVMIWRQIAPP